MRTFLKLFLACLALIGLALLILQLTQGEAPQGFVYDGIG